jgi:FkbM family methyltransferase
VPASGIFVDVGAHCGSFSIPFESFFDRVLAFEPLPENYRAMERNIALNHLQGKIAAFHVAAGAAHAQGKLFLRGDEMSSIIPTEASSGTVGVEVRALDDVLKDECVSPCDVRLLKADVEGAELQVLDGARRLLEKGSPIVVLEANTAGTKERLERFMDDMGYVLLRVADGRNLCFERFLGQSPPRPVAFGFAVGALVSRRRTLSR